MSNPGLYYNNNVAKTNQLLCDLHAENWHGKIIFSSSASTYGNNDNKYDKPLLETDEKKPISPYGRSKLICEQIIEDHCKAFGFKGIALRYFNASGCDVDGSLGNAKYDTHLIPRIVESILSKKQFVLNGNDFATPDGTCLRDYLHVNDIANAHLEAVKYADSFSPNQFDVFNLGTGSGFTNLQIVEECERVIGTKLDVLIGPRLIGDPDARIADPNKFISATTWKPKYSNLENIIGTTYNWMEKFNYSQL
jgi:UDP-glucose 4-epimerase